MKKAKYILIQEELEKRILNNVYPSGGRMPTEITLAKEFGVNRHTLRRAMNYLEELKYIKRSPRIGSIVVYGQELHASHKAVRLNFRFMANRGPVISSYYLNRKRVFEEIAANFNAEYPWIKVNIDPILSVSNSLTSCKPELYKGNGPSVVYLFYYGDDSRLGKLLPLEDFSDISDISAQIEGRLLHRTKDPQGRYRIHAIPVQTASWMMIVNMSLFKSLGFTEEDLPKTWDNFLDICREISEKFKSQGIYPLEKELFYGPQSVTRYLPYIYMAGNGKSIIEKNERININTPGCIEFLHWLKKVYKYAGMAADLSQGDLFHKSKAVFRLSAAELSPTEDHRPIPFPVCSTSQKTCTVIHGGFVGIAADGVKNSSEKDAAWLFIKYLISQDVQNKLCKDLNIIPSRTDMYSEINASGRFTADIYDYALRYGMPTFDISRNDDFHTTIQNSFMRAISGKCSIEEALREAQNLLDVYLSDNIPAGSNQFFEFI